MTKDTLLSIFNSGRFDYRSVSLNEPEMNLLCFNWRQIHLPVEDIDYTGTIPLSTFCGIDENGKEELFRMPVRMKSFAIELPFDLRKFKRHYLNLFGEHLLAHEILRAMDKYYGDKQLLAAVCDLDYIELAFLINEKRTKFPRKSKV